MSGDAFGGVLLRSGSSIADIRDGHIAWRNDNVGSPAYLLAERRGGDTRTDFALSPNGDVYVTQNQDLGFYSDYPSIPSSSSQYHLQKTYLVALDGQTGVPKNSVQVPNVVSVNDGTPCNDSLSYTENLPMIGPPLATLDGTVYIDVVTSENQSQEFAHFNSDGEIICGSYGSSKGGMMLLGLKPDGSHTLSYVKNMDATSLVEDIRGGGAGSDVFIRDMGDLVPDGNGGLVAIWEEFGGTGSPVKARHITDPASGAGVSYDVPLCAIDELVVGENNQAIAQGIPADCDGSDNGLVAFDMNSGATSLERQSSQQRVKIVSTLSGGGILAKEGPYSNFRSDFDDPTGLFNLDNTGAYTPLQNLSSQNDIQLADEGNLLGGGATVVATASSLVPGTSPAAKSNQAGQRQEQALLAQLPSCLTGDSQCPGIKEAIYNAWRALKSQIALNCPSCQAYVFSNLKDANGFSLNNTRFNAFLTPRPLYYDGTKSTARKCNNFFPCGFLQKITDDGTIDRWFADNGTDVDAATLTPGQPMKTFFRLPSISSDNSGANTANMSLLFHEALHGMTGESDSGLQNLLSCQTHDGTDTHNITDYLSQFMSSDPPVSIQGCQ